MSWRLPPSWSRVLTEELSTPWFAALRRQIDAERQRHAVYPSAADVFRAFRLTAFQAVRVVLLGQDPYHDEGQAHGLCFSVPRGVPLPPSLVNICKELDADLGFSVPESGDLTPWAKQGVLMLNTVLTVRAHEPHAHRGMGWERLTDAVIRRVAEKPEPVVFVLWGQPAQKKIGLIDASRHAVLCAAHPSPLSAHRGFFGSRPFSQINGRLRSWGQPEIDWRIDS